ncbi:MAG: SpoIID/LytB domain-containing protein [Dethiobacter sp.]|jgi:stage II sporulation protein D|nr:MAG: SpoIID/LytB domain-containing protein [Dethiobacter sp.]
MKFRLEKRYCFPICIVVLIFFLFTFFCQVPAYSAYPPEMRVGISLLNSHVELSFDSGYCLVNKASGTTLPLPAGNYRLVNVCSGIQVLDMPGNSQGVFSGPLELKPLSSQSSGQSFQLHNARYGQEYRGALEVFAEGNTLRAVNILDLESYLRGVLAREMPSSWGNYGGMEALKAQAVAARTYALYNHSLQRHTGFHLCDSQHCQVYGGKNSETGNTDSALSQTRGEILTFNNRVIAPFYHASNGGYTEAPQNVWTSGLPYFTSVPDPYDDPDNPPPGLVNFVVHRYARWEADVPLSSLGLLLAKSGFSNPGEIERVDIVSAFPSGRVEDVRIRGTGGAVVSLLKEKARTALGLRSQLYTVRSEPEPRVWIASSVNGMERKESFPELEGKWVASGYTMKRMLIGESFSAQGNGTKSFVPYQALIFEGRGWGHGIGMSQNGAYNRSRAGHGYRDILSFYYPGTQIDIGY